jgi:hypothetical protein
MEKKDLLLNYYGKFKFGLFQCDNDKRILKPILSIFSLSTSVERFFRLLFKDTGFENQYFFCILVLHLR